MTNKEKISDLPSYSKINNEAKEYFILGKIIKILTFFGSKNGEVKKALSKLPELKKQTELIIFMPDKFNGYYSCSGWIAHESMNFPLMERAVLYASEGNMTKGEEELSDYFISQDIDWLVRGLKNLPEFAIRFKLIKLAYKDTIEKRYYASILLLLSIIDGVVNDISKSKGFFTETTDLMAWDSVAAHSTGLSSIRDIFNQTRKKTNSEEIFLPLRNGILHGRDLNYDNKFVLGKCWCTLLALYDWAQALNKLKENPPLPEKQLTFKESIQELRNTIEEYQQSKIRNEKIHQDVENWKPRVIDNKNINPENFHEFSPEKEAYQFCLNWLNKNYGKIAVQKYHFGKNDINIGKESGKIRKELEDKVLNDFNIINIKDETPAISEITVNVQYQINSEIKEKQIVLRMICKSSDGRIGINGYSDVVWKFVDNFFYGLYV